jgi:hypothetical protein
MWNLFKKMVTSWKMWVFSAIAACTWGAIYYAFRKFQDDEPIFSRSRS